MPVASRLKGVQRLAASRLGLFGRASTPSPPKGFGLAVKRSVDVGLGVALAVIALPLMASIALAIKLDSAGPALYRPSRVGKGGAVFSMYKFRTMVDGADEKLKELAHLNVASG